MARKKNAIVTGASRGIGKSVALKLAKEGYNVQIFGRDKSKLRTLANKLNKIGSESDFFIGDVADEDFVQNSVTTILKKNKKIDLLVNNAGVAIFKKFIDTSINDFKTQIDANLIGTFNFSKSVIESMIEKKNGTIVNVVSQAGKFGFNYGSTYAATKHAVLGFSKSLMLEVRKFNIRIISICPGSVDTEMIAESPIHQNINQVLKPTDIAEILYNSVKMPNRVLTSEIDIRPNNP